MTIITIIIIIIVVFVVMILLMEEILHQSRLVVYHIIYMVLYMSAGAGCRISSINSSIDKQNW